MGWVSDGWDWVKDKAKDVGSGILSIILGTLIHYIYIGAVYASNFFKSKKRISECLIKVLEDLDLFSSNVNLNKVRIIQNARGLDGAGLTNKNTIYISGILDVDTRLGLRLLLHELKHVEQYLDLGYAVFVATYDYQIVRYGYDNAPLENTARDFADEKYVSVRNRYNTDCKPVTDPDSPVFKQMIIDEDWTLLLDLI